MPMTFPAKICYAEREVNKRNRTINVALPMSDGWAAFVTLFSRRKGEKTMPRNKKQGIALPIQMLLVAPLSLRLARVLVKG